jgi:steroid delta-isomerase-like uncharacterized protein
MQDTNKQVVRQLFEDGFNRGAAIDALVADPKPFEQVMVRLRGAFPDIHYTIEEVVAEGDRVAVRWQWTGKHEGVFRGVAPTHRTVTNRGMAVFQLQDGRITASALETDRLGFLQAIGVVPPDDQLFR